jgi:hypothetical protein
VERRIVTVRLGLLAGAAASFLVVFAGAAFAAVEPQEILLPVGGSAQLVYQAEGWLQGTSARVSVSVRVGISNDPPNGNVVKTRSRSCVKGPYYYNGLCLLLFLRQRRGALRLQQSWHRHGLFQDSGLRRRGGCIRGDVRFRSDDRGY